MFFRPWGLLDWALSLSEARKWFFVGALGTEVRSLAAWRGVRALNLEVEHRLLEIHDSKSRYTNEALVLLKERFSEFVKNGGRNDWIYHGIGLLDEFYKIDDLSKSLSDTGHPVILDITSLPKRYFFPILRRLYKSPKVKDLVITYTLPEEYAQDGRPLSEGLGNWNHLPGFLPPQIESTELLIAGAGFATQNLMNHIRSITRHEAIKLLIPFPAPLGAVLREWQAVYQLQGDLPPGKFMNYRVPANDISAAFDRIVSLARNTDAEPAFAPFGPKPISAAMCIFASQRESAVYYPQPIAYHPNYSTGIGKCEGKDAVFAYWVKHTGENLYKI